ncbi:hypothetical protein C4J81_19025 (plasmid) [Deltaproteobacteria bacterium Smac51]|nr:hypothetical protein C4J81_19025 [Deltaproteobacteria bacterium Smac51]
MDIWKPLTTRTAYNDLVSIMEERAARPAEWAAQWPDNPRLIQARDRMGPLLMVYNCGGWPNVFFVPGDSVIALLCEGADSIDLVEFILAMEEIFGVDLPDELALKSVRLNYGEFLKSWLELAAPEADLEGAAHQWEPLKLRPGHYKQSWWAALKRRMPGGWDHVEHWRLRTALALRPKTWPDQWPPEAALLAARDRAGRLLAEKLDWPEAAFIPGDRLEAVFHSQGGLAALKEALAAINSEFGRAVSLDYVISGQHTYEDFLRRLLAPA